MYGGSPLDHQVAQEALVCGLPIDGASVGKPGELVQCRCAAFWIYPGEQGIQTQCTACKQKDRLRGVLPVTFGGDGRVTEASRRQDAKGPAGERQCGEMSSGQPCSENRFLLAERGGETLATCVHCGFPAALGMRAALGR
jgi:hypothetical protein